MIGFTKEVRQLPQEQDQEPHVGRITLTSVLVMVAVLGMAVVNQYLTQQ